MSERIETYKEMKEYWCETCVGSCEKECPYNQIEQALIKAEESERKAKAFDLIKEIGLAEIMWIVYECDTYDWYVRWRDEPISKETFDFLKEIFYESNND